MPTITAQLKDGTHVIRVPAKEVGSREPRWWCSDWLLTPTCPGRESMHTDPSPSDAPMAWVEYKPEWSVTTMSWAESMSRKKLEKRRWLRELRPAKDNTVYLIGSLRNPSISAIGNKLRAAGWDVFDDWFSGGPGADDAWRDYEKARGHNFIEALHGPSAHNIFEFDKRHIERCSTGLLVMPAGKSAHLELGTGFLGCGKPGYVLLDGDPDRFDVMYQFACGVFADVDAFLETVTPP